MSAPIAKSQLQFALPNLSYVDARWEEPELHAPARARAPAAKPGLLARLATWTRRQREAAELGGMTERELSDIGLNRGDIGRVFSIEHSKDLREARALLG